MNSYRGTGTMLLFSGSFSRIADAAAVQILQRPDGAKEDGVASVCQLLQGNPAVLGLRSEFQPFAKSLAADFRFERASVALDLVTDPATEQE